MEVVHLNQKQLAARGHVSEACLERWRCEGIGPKFMKLSGRVLYRMVDIEAYEESCLQEFSWKAGEVAFSEAVNLEVINIGTTEGHNIVVELKETPGQASHH